MNCMIKEPGGIILLTLPHHLDCLGLQTEPPSIRREFIGPALFPKYTNILQLYLLNLLDLKDQV